MREVSVHTPLQRAFRVAVGLCCWAMLGCVESSFDDRGHDGPGFALGSSAAEFSGPAAFSVVDHGGAAALRNLESLGSGGLEASVLDSIEFASFNTAAADATVVEYGRSVEGRALWLIRLQGRGEPQGALRPAALLMGVAQGVEHLAVVDALPAVFAAAELEHPGGSEALTGVGRFFDAGGVLYAATVVNPDALAAGEYFNANGVNLNRDWADQTQPETRALVQYLEQESQHVDLRLVIDYHIGIPRLLHPRADSRFALPVAELERHLKAHEMMPEMIAKPPISLFDSIRDLYDSQTHCDVVNDCALTPRCISGEWNCECLHDPEWEGGRCIFEPFDVVEIERHGLSNDFFHDTFGAAAFIYEAEVEVDYDNVRDHAIWWDRLLADLADDGDFSGP